MKIIVFIGSYKDIKCAEVTMETPKMYRIKPITSSKLSKYSTYSSAVYKNNVLLVTEDDTAALSLLTICENKKKEKNDAVSTAIKTYKNFLAELLAHKA